MIKLPRLPLGWKNQPQLFERYWHEAMTQIEKTLNDVLAIPAIEAAIAAANDAAIAANNAAIAANDAIDAQRSDTSLTNSYVDTSSYVGTLITCTSAGLVTIKTHTRIYGDPSLNPNSSVTGNTFTVGAAVPGDLIRIYYADTNRTGGSVTYQYTIDPAPPPVQTGNIHSVGVVEVPVTGTANGKEIKNPGYVYD